MTDGPRSRLPVPVEVLGLDFLSSRQAPTHVVLEFRTASNPIRVFLSKAQVEELQRKSGIAATKIDG
jgi:hypothetical protein